MRNALFTLGALALIGGLCGALLSVTDALTSEKRADNQRQQSQRLLADMLGHAVPPGLIWRDEIATDCQDITPSWHLLRGQAQGYAGKLEYLALLRHLESEVDSGTLTLRVLRHQETPGIGDYIDHNKSDYLPAKDQLELDQWRQLDNVSGATVTQRAITRAVEDSAALLTTHLQRLQEKDLRHGQYHPCSQD